MHTSVVCTQRRPSCAPSVISACTIWIHSRDMRTSTSRVFLVLGVMSWWGGLNHFIFFNANFLSVMFFRGRGIVKLVQTILLFCKRGGHKSRQADFISHV